MAARSYWNAEDKEAARAKWETYIELQPDGEFKDEAEAALRRSVAVLNFTTGGDLARDRGNVGSTFADTLTTRLAAVPDIDVVERTQVSRLLGEQRFQNQGWTDPQFAQDFGQILNAEYLIVGNVFKEDDTVQATARVISTATGRVEGEGVVVTAGSLIDLMSKTATSLLQWWGYQTPEAEGVPDEEMKLPELSQEEIQNLLKLLPQGTTIEELDIPEADVERAYFLGLNYLRHGLIRKSAFWVNQALSKFNIVVELAPEFPQGHFQAGLCLYYLENYRDAQFAFIEAVKLEDSLWEQCPLLYYNDCGPDWPLVATRILGMEDAVQMEHFVRLQPELQPRNLALVPVSQLLSGERMVSDIHMEAWVRFRGMHGKDWEPYIALRARMHNDGSRGSVYLQGAVRGNGLVDFRWVAHPGGVYEKRVLDNREISLSRNKWYRFVFELIGGEYLVSIDGHPILNNIGDPNPTLNMAGNATIEIYTAGGNTVDIDDILITRLYPSE